MPALTGCSSVAIGPRVLPAVSFSARASPTPVLPGGMASVEVKSNEGRGVSTALELVRAPVVWLGDPVNCPAGVALGSAGASTGLAPGDVVAAGGGRATSGGAPRTGVIPVGSGVAGGGAPGVVVSTSDSESEPESIPDDMPSDTESSASSTPPSSAPRVTPGSTGLGVGDGGAAG